ncbi:MAG: universal stress protein [Actinomycetes bacterium]
MSQYKRPDDWEAPVVLPEAPDLGRILVPFDGSHTAERALAWSVLAAHNNDAEIVVVVAFDPPLTMRGRGAAFIESVQAGLLEEAQTLAEESVLLLRQKGVRARGVVVRGDVARGILQVADDEAVDLIVIGRQGLTHEVGGGVERVRRIMVGGVSEKVSRHAAVPVLVVV